MHSFPVRALRIASGMALGWPLLLGGCESAVAPVKLVQLQLVSGGDQVGGAGTMLELPITVAVLDDEGGPVADADVHWQVVQGGGAAGAPLTRTDSSGHTSTRWKLGVDQGTNLLLVQAGNATLTIRATAEFRITQVAAGYRHTCALSSAGALFCWGSNVNGQLGDDTGVSSARPVRVIGQVAFRYVNAGWFHTCAATHFEQMFCWGDNSAGQLGIGTPGPFQFFPARVALTPPPVEIAGGYVHTCVVEDGGRLSCWGESERGRLASASGITRVAAGEFHSCALRQDGRALCWGWNSLGEIGIDAPRGAVITTPTSVSDTIRFNALTASARHTCGVSTEQKVLCWGRSAAGEIGQDPHDHRSQPAVVEGATGFTRITTGNTHTCGIAGARAYCWGSWLGDGSSASSKRPVPVSGLAGVTAIAAGFDHTCAVARGEVWCWGSNLHGQLGQQNQAQSLVPVRVSF